jgi:hypothetical protein
MKTLRWQALDLSGDNPKVKYGIKVFTEGNWFPVCHKNEETGEFEATLFDTEEEVEQMRKKLRKRKSRL